MAKTRLNAGAVKLRAWLIGHGVSQISFAERVGLVNGTLINYCAGRFLPSLVTADKISRATDNEVTAADWLKPYKGPKTPSFKRGRMHRKDERKQATVK